MSRVRFSKRMDPWATVHDQVGDRQSARNSERALRAAQLKFMRWSRIPHWRVRADEAKVEALSSVSG